MDNDRLENPQHGLAGKPRDVVPRRPEDEESGPDASGPAGWEAPEGRADRGAGARPVSAGPGGVSDGASPGGEEVVVPLLVERLRVAKRRVEGRVVRVATRTHEREHLVDEELTHERVEVERVPVGRVVDAVPPVREEGGATILPVVEEVVVIERRLVLKEEIHIRRVQATGRHRERVTLREQDAVITRTPARDAAGDIAIPPPPKRAD